MAATTIQEAGLAPASDLAALLEDEPALTAAEAQAIVAEWIARATAPPRAMTSARACRCLHVWHFEPGHCCACGHDLGRPRR